MPSCRSVLSPTAVPMVEVIRFSARMPGQEEVDVAAAARDRDGAAEDVDEQHREQHRLDRHVRELHRLPRDVHQVAPGHGPDVDQRPSTLLPSAGRPTAVGDGVSVVVVMRRSFQLVRASRARTLVRAAPRPAAATPRRHPIAFALLFDVPTGEREEHVVERRLPHLDVVHQHSRRRSSARTTAVASPVDASTPALRRRPSSLTVDLPAPPAAPSPPTAAGVRLGQRHLQAGAPARLLQLLRRPVGDHPAVVDDHDRGGPARRPPRGTASSAAR